MTVNGGAKNDDTDQNVHEDHRNIADIRRALRFACHGGQIGGVMEPKLSSDLLRGHTDSIVLAILHKGDAYGFEIYNTILERTEEQYELKETTLYSSYKRLEQEGCISSYWGDETQGARRRYYHLTEKGRAVYEQNMKDWEFTRRILTNLLEMA
jgi:DNA-binding PadR family transcriptional regulator